MQVYTRFAVTDKEKLVNVMTNYKKDKPNNNKKNAARKIKHI